jgi:hypothetical protein
MAGELKVAAETEVENVLHEIRQGLRAELRARSLDESEPSATKVVRLENYLAVTERAWNRLPPVVSNRRGWVAKLELLIKRLLKRATHWYTWEQVNFNGAVNGALHAAQAAFSEQEQRQSLIESRLAELEASIEEVRAIKAELERLQRTLQSGNKAR